jgi:hypothetical protein
VCVFGKQQPSSTIQHQTPNTHHSKQTTLKQLPAEHALELPLWLAAPLVERHIVDAALPRAYGESSRRRADAGASCVSLKGTPHFYAAGLACSAL